MNLGESVVPGSLEASRVRMDTHSELFSTVSCNGSVDMSCFTQTDQHTPLPAPRIMGQAQDPLPLEVLGVRTKDSGNDLPKFVVQPEDMPSWQKFARRFTLHPDFEAIVVLLVLVDCVVLSIYRPLENDEFITNEVMRQTGAESPEILFSKIN